MASNDTASQWSEPCRACAERGALGGQPSERAAVSPVPYATGTPPRDANLTRSKPNSKQQFPADDGRPPALRRPWLQRLQSISASSITKHSASQLLKRMTAPNSPLVTELQTVLEFFEVLKYSTFNKFASYYNTLGERCILVVVTTHKLRSLTECCTCQCRYRLISKLCDTRQFSFIIWSKKLRERENLSFTLATWSLIERRSISRM